MADLVPYILRPGKIRGNKCRQQPKIQVEFVSANPTGDLHSTCGAAVGDSLCNILEKAGYDVTREYYINDVETKSKISPCLLRPVTFRRSALKENAGRRLLRRHIIEIGKRLAEEFGDKYVHASEEERFEFFREYGLKYELRN